MSIMAADELSGKVSLEHPLPEEIQNMDRDDTVCKFCGVSYFIHHEIKKLETEVRILPPPSRTYGFWNFNHHFLVLLPYKLNK